MKIINHTEQEERQYLERILQQLEWALQHSDRQTRQFSREFREDQSYLRDQRSGMDEADVVSAGQSFTRMAFQGESAIVARRKLTKLSETPYFGRIDFAQNGRTNRLPIYIGMYSFIGGTPDTYPIYDWRAPVSSMFYDFELGKAWYETPAGTVNGNIELRRQYRIRKGRMEYMIENSVNIQDDLLQRELSQASDDKMKQIVATIQRDQNAIIRNETSPVMIIQGVAGSGKTSIAIHRIAFLLYRFRDTIRSKDMLIISPNKVFADYISNVLPELGEAQIPEMGMEELAHDLLDHKFRFQSFLQQVFSLLNKQDKRIIERVRFKASAEFIGQLNRYLVYLENQWFKAMDVRVGEVLVPASFVQERFQALQRLPLLSRLPMVIQEVRDFVRAAINRKLSGREKSAIHQALSTALPRANVLELYRDFYEWLGRKDLFRMQGNVLEYADVFPLIYCKIRLEGIQAYQEVKHLVIDEMQDYTPIQYAVLARLFPGKKTILGDASQTANPHSATNAEEIQKVFPQADVVKLVRSYRSTYEITRFTQEINPNPDLLAMERHGPAPEVLGFSRQEDEMEAIKQRVDRFRASNHHMLAIICKTPAQARALNDRLAAPDVYLLSEESTFFKEGVVITTAPMAKGLEFDEVIVPYVSLNNYRNDMDKNMLYIACTRAMHQLMVTYHGLSSPFLEGIA
ncbi:HelD family protein [Catalinimonas niigatensis]|uniref:HelD family protein n=1 Tax=Catalinimonas niigatensis TaxID=1397264 RepID=UPI0026653DDE|nr:UvrD-helicase domain-containing protein [Catalinimonas niigatensis]WPP52017.1 AAA family ATPase [Catalinimonas niigatensis]